MGGYRGALYPEIIAGDFQPVWDILLDCVAIWTKRTSFYYADALLIFKIITGDMNLPDCATYIDSVGKSCANVKTLSFFLSY